MSTAGGPEDPGTGARRRRPRAEPSPAQRALGLLVRREHSAFAALAESGEDDWAGVARDLVARRFPAAEDEEAEASRSRRRKAADFLLRRGFDVETARAASGLDDDG
ncbi:RecX family transcriptional regulator [Luteimonas huabeiensis]|uniref:RecX family transcriptional regulator n=1 Tax=Luteimonas huabeiensis TaxID=1244513 RepID=UPI0004646EDE|nr:RecX family transcriptional regulator [Luteimonas huabeiensis]